MGLGYGDTTFLAVPGRKQLALEGIRAPVLAAAEGKADSGNRMKISG